MFGTTPINEALNLASMRLLNLKYRNHKKVLIVVSDGEFEINGSTQSLITPIDTLASLLKQSDVTIVSLYVTLSMGSYKP
jgi:Mg-chelatase subunit ChlD